jgi:hypothetical protein
MRWPSSSNASAPEEQGQALVAGNRFHHVDPPRADDPFGDHTIITIRTQVGVKDPRLCRGPISQAGGAQQQR